MILHTHIEGAVQQYILPVKRKSVAPEVFSSTDREWSMHLRVCLSIYDWPELWLAKDAQWHRILREKPKHWEEETDNLSFPAYFGAYKIQSVIFCLLTMHQGHLIVSAA